MRILKLELAVVLLAGYTTSVAAQQVADSAFRPPITRSAYASGSGPLVVIDEAHDNFHTASGRYYPFAELLHRDGYVVRPSITDFTAATLRGTGMLVIANARKAITRDEVFAVRAWVENGGALLLIVDHPPNVVAAEELGKMFGVRFRNGGAFDPGSSDNRIVFRRGDGGLLDHKVTSGVDSVVTFTGSSFQIEGAGQGMLVLGPNVVSYVEENDPNPLPVEGHLQGAVLTVGKGRVAVFAEAAMFSAQLAGPERRAMGMNAPSASQNVALLLNVVHWLTGVLEWVAPSGLEKDW